MMSCGRVQFNVGDEVRVIGPSLEWRDVRGTVVEITERICGDRNEKLQECAVKFHSERRWFMSQHLSKIIPKKTIRFLRAEVIERWPIDPDRVLSPDGGRVQLIGLLQDNFDFSLRRATAEVDEFLHVFDDKLRRATQVSPEAPAPDHAMSPAHSAA
jgi:hypothetical protein